MKVRLVLLALLAALAAVLVVGCGGSSGSGGGDPATLAPPKAPLYVAVTVRPEGEEQSNINALAKSIGGVDDLGELIISKLEEAANSEGEEFDYETEVEPWLGEKAGISFQSYDGSDFHGYGIAVQSTDTGAAEEFIEKQVEESKETVKEGSFEGVDFQIQEDGTTIGVIGEFFAIAEDEAAFKGMVEASEGESLSEEADFSDAIAAAPSDSFADVFVDIGGLIEEAGNGIDPEAQTFLDSVGIDPSEATAVASLVPGSDNLEIDFNSDLSSQNPPSGDASKLLGSLPASSFAAVASPEFGKRFEEAIDSIDASGIPGQVPPHKLKSTLKAAGLDLEKISASIGDLGVFAEGNSERNLRGALVLETSNSQEAKNTVANVGLLLRASGTPGVTAISGPVSGFSIPSSSFGGNPLIIGAGGERIVVADGLTAAAQALSTEGGQKLADNATYKEAVSALGDTPISGFVNGQTALTLASSLVPPGNEGFQTAKRYLNKVTYVAIGGGASGDRSTAKVIVGIGK